MNVTASLGVVLPSTIPNPHDVLRPQNARFNVCLNYLTSNLDAWLSDNAEGSPRYMASFI